MNKKVRFGKLIIIMFVLVLVTACSSPFNFSSKCDEKTNDPDTNYKKYAENYIKFRGKLGESFQSVNRFGNVEDSDYIGVETVEVRPNGDLYLSFGSEELKSKYGQEYKVLSNVLSVYSVERGQMGFRYIVAIKENGTIAVIDSMELINANNIKVITDFDNIKNIVNVLGFIDTDGLAAASVIKVVDIEGKVHAVRF